MKRKGKEEKNFWPVRGGGESISEPDQISVQVDITISVYAVPTYYARNFGLCGSLWVE